MHIGLYAYNTYGKKKTDAFDGAMQILDPDRCFLDMLVLPEYTNITKEETLELSRFSPECIIIPGSTLERVDKQIFNRTYVAYDGKIVGKYDKRTSCAKEGFCDQDHLPYDRGRKEAFCKGENPFEIYLDEISSDFPRIKMGIENCSDNSELLNKKYNLDLLVFISSGAFGTVRNSIKLGGGYVHVDGCARKSDGKTSAYAEYKGKQLKPTINPKLIRTNDESYLISIYNFPFEKK